MPNPALGFYSVLPDFSNGLSIPSIGPVLFKLQFDKIASLEFVVVMFAFLFVDMFDTIGTLIGVSTKAGMLDRDGKLPNIRGALLADAVATTAGAMLGTTTVTTFVESASGVAEGGRTGLAAFSTAVLFGVSFFLSGIVSIIPGAATSPALIVVGVLMLGVVTKINFHDLTEGAPAFFAITLMPFTMSVAEGVVGAVISYVVLKLATGRRKEIKPIMYILAILFVLKLALT